MSTTTTIQHLKVFQHINRIPNVQGQSSQAQEEGQVPPAADPAAPGGQPAGEEEDAVDKRRVRDAARPHTDPPLREAALQAGHPQAGDRIHQLPERARQEGPELQLGVLQPAQQEHAEGRAEEDYREK